MLLSADGLAIRPVVERFHAPQVVEVIASDEAPAVASKTDELAYQPSESDAADMFGFAAEKSLPEVIPAVADVLQSKAVSSAVESVRVTQSTALATPLSGEAAEPQSRVLGTEDEAAQATPIFVRPVQDQLVTGLTVGNAPPTKNPVKTALSVEPAAQTRAGIAFSFSSSLADLQAFITGKLSDYLTGLLSGTRTFSPGTLSLDGFFTLVNPSLTFSSIVINGGAVTAGTVTIATEGATLFDGRPFSASVTDGDDADSLAASGAYDVATKAYSFAAGQFKLTIGEALRVEAATVTVTYSSTNSAADQTLAMVGTGLISSPIFSGLGTASLSGLVIRKNGFHVDDATLTLANGGTASIGSILSVTGLTLAVDDLDVAYSSGVTVSGTVTMTAAGLKLYPTGSFVTTNAQGVVATFDLASGNPSGRLTLHIASLELAFGQALKVTASNVSLTPGASDVLASIGAGTVSVPLVSGLPTASVTDFRLRRTGLEIGSLTLAGAGAGTSIGDAVGKILRYDTVTVTVTDFSFNYGTRPGVSGLVTVNLTNASLFPDITFLNNSVGSVTGSFSFGGGPAVLTLDITDFQMAIGDAVTLSFGNVQLRPTEDIMLTATNVAVKSTLITGLEGSLASFQLRRSGFTIESLVLMATADRSLGGFMDIVGPITLTVSSFVLDRNATNKVTGSVTLSLAGIRLFPNGGFVTTSASNLAVTYDFSNGLASAGDLSIQVGTFKLGFGEALEISATNVLLTPGAPDVFASIGSATARSPQFEFLPTISLTNLKLRRTGISLGSGSATMSVGGPGDAVGKFVKFDALTLTLSDFTLDYGAITSTHGTIGVSITNFVLLPEVAFINKNLGNITGTYTFHSPAILNLDIPAFELPLGDALKLKFGPVKLRPGQEVMLDAKQVVVESSLFSGLSGTLDSLQITRHGLAISALTLSATGPIRIGNFIELRDVYLRVSDFKVDRLAVAPNPKVGGVIELSVGDLV